MNLVEAAERFAATDRSRLALDPTLCLLSIDSFADCRRCAEICPAGAIHWARPPEFDQDECLNCLGCLDVCPTGAFHGRDAFASLLRCVSHLDTTSIDILCNRNPSAQFGPAGSQAGVSIRGCIAGLGRAAYLALAALGLEEVRLRLDACCTCPVGPLEAEILRQLDEAKIFLAADPSDRRMKLSVVSESCEEGRPVWDADNPPISRRDFFRLAGTQSQLTAARAMFDLEPDQGRGPTLRRRRELAALARLDERRQTPAEGMLVGLGYAAVEITSACSACGACARACPTGALALELTDEDYRLLFEPAACNGCGVCTHVCAEEAISISSEPDYRDVFGLAERVTVSAGGMRRCSLCNTRIASADGRTVCSLCAYRMEHPFGSHLPPHLAAKIQTSAVDSLRADTSSSGDRSATGEEAEAL
jgi:ferredoxin